MLELISSVLVALALEDAFPVGSKHGVSLSRAGLPICKNREVITLENISYVWFYEVKYFLLGRVFTECSVKGCY